VSDIDFLLLTVFPTFAKPEFARLERLVDVDDGPSRDTRESGVRRTASADVVVALVDDGDRIRRAEVSDSHRSMSLESLLPLPVPEEDIASYVKPVSCKP
jgi:hypothetical protein